MRPASYIAALVALPIEAVNLWLVLHFPIDAGLPPGTSIWIRAIFFQSVFLHIPALRLDYWLQGDGITEGVFATLCLATGYVETFSLLLALILNLRWLRAKARKSGTTGSAN